MHLTRFYCIINKFGHPITTKGNKFIFWSWRWNVITFDWLPTPGISFCHSSGYEKEETVPPCTHREPFVNHPLRTSENHREQIKALTRILKMKKTIRRHLMLLWMLHLSQPKRPNPNLKSFYGNACNSN